MKILTLTLLLLSFFSCGKEYSFVDKASGLTYVTTSGGVRLKAEVGVNHQVLEAALTEVAKRARCLGYDKELELSDYIVAVLTPELQYKGIGVFRYQDGYIAGMYHPSTDTLILADQPDLTEIATHEATHRVYRWNDKNKFEQFKVHVDGEQGFTLPPCQT